MDRNGMLPLLLLFFIVADVSNASLLSNFQRFVTVASAGRLNTNQVSPSPSPDPLQTSANTTTNKTSSNDTKVDSSLNDTKVKVDSSSNDTKVDSSSNDTMVDSSSKGSNLTLTADPPPPPPLNNNNGGKINNNDTKTDSQSVAGLNCTGFPRRCSDGNNLVACILNFQTEHQKFVVLAQNEGESDMHIDLSAPDPANSTSFEIPKHESREITLLFGNSNEVVLKSGYGDCILHIDVGVPTSKGNYFLYLPSYDKLVTPINGAYLLIVTVLIFGGMSICWLFRKKRRQDSIGYQELEMGLPESSLSNSVETAEGWDEGWDDEWDEENAVKSPAGQHATGISANGLTSRSTKKDEWENDWDD
ncbi:uncharacterized protein [Euphorbia lathyris]|uniref:uncharacterized protein n=1 Tax=Euphorbia lathyris TaxID=212925 RepID=UPI0033140FC4